MGQGQRVLSSSRCARGPGLLRSAQSDLHGGPFQSRSREGKGLQAGDGIPVHVTIPTDRPWVPLRILALGRGADEVVEADVFLLNETKPLLMPGLDEAGSNEGLVHERSEEASEALLTDLASDRGMEWLPTKDIWLDYIRISTRARILITTSQSVWTARLLRPLTLATLSPPRPFRTRSRHRSGHGSWEWHWSC